jgi:ribonuclease Y
VTALLFALAGLILGVGAGLLIRSNRDQKVLNEARAEADRIRQEARQEAETLKRETANEARTAAEREAERITQTARETAERERSETLRDAERMREDASRGQEELSRAREEVKRERDKLDGFEERLTRRGEQQDARALRLDEQEEALDAREVDLRTRQDALADKEASIERELQTVASLSREQAEARLLERVDRELDREKAIRVRASVEQADAESKRTVQNILAQAIQRSASEVSAAVATTVVPIPSDGMKGRIIGREGRNIRAFESLTGVDLIIDDTPEAVLLSSFNPMRREVAKLALNELIDDGRIHPARIEEVVQKAQQDMQSYIRERGDEAILEANVTGIKPGMLQLLGRMHFRTSYGQNILQHSVQVAHICGILAAELGIDEGMARRAGLLHDIGKSIDRELEGTHTEIGANLGRRFGEPDEVIDAIANHHDLDRAETLFPILVSAADAVSAARPGARRESLEVYLKRLEGLEAIASSFPGVEKSFAIQAGREVRVIVEPTEIDDDTAALLARDVANRIEQDMEYPGQVQVTVVRETRSVQYAR